ncbi:MAG: hypothetical protein AAB074_11110 [Planctomycetota bacterium]
MRESASPAEGTNRLRAQGSREVSWKYLLPLAVLCLAMIVAWKPPDERLESKELVIYDEHGRACIRLSAVDGNPEMLLTSSNSKASIRVRILGDGISEVKMCDASGKDRVEVGVDSKNRATVRVRSEGQRHLCNIVAHKESASVELKENDTKHVVSLETSSDGAGRIDFVDDTGHAYIEFGADKRGELSHLILTSGKGAGVEDARLHLEQVGGVPRTYLRSGLGVDIWSSDK